MSIRTRILLLGALAVSGLLVILAIQVSAEFKSRSVKQELLVQTQVAEKLSDLIHELQRERGVSVGYLARGAGQDASALQEQRAATDGKAIILVQRPGFTTQRAELQAVRGRIDHDQISAQDATAQISAIIVNLLDEIDRLAERSTSPLLQADLEAHTHLLYAKEYLGLERATLMEYFAAGSIDNQGVARLGKLQGLFDEHCRIARRTATPQLARSLEAALVDGRVRAAQDIVRAAIADPDKTLMEVSSERWFSTATAAIDLLKDQEKVSMAQVRDRVEEEISAADQRLVASAGSTIAVSALLIFLAATAIHRILKALDILLEGIARIAETRNFANRIPLHSRDEMGVIARSFNTLLEVAERLIEEKDFLANFDQLTGACNRHKAADLFAGMREYEERYRHGLAMIVLDVDHFKKINDQFGHGAGDKVLKELTGLIRERIRSSDVLARWGGEEFMILIGEGGRDAAQGLAEKLRESIEAHAFPDVPGVTASFGVDEYIPGDSLETLCARADQALYEAKRQGRNRVCAFLPPPAAAKAG